MLKHRIGLMLSTVLFILLYFLSLLYRVQTFALLAGACFLVAFFVIEATKCTGGRKALSKAAYAGIVLITAVLLSVFEEHFILVKDPSILGQSGIHNVMFGLIPFFVAETVSMFLRRQDVCS